MNPIGKAHKIKIISTLVYSKINGLLYSSLGLYIARWKLFGMQVGSLIIISHASPSAMIQKSVCLYAQTISRSVLLNRKKDSWKCQNKLP